MSAFSETVRSDILAMMEDNPVRFQFNGLEYVGDWSGLIEQSSHEIGGFEERPEITLAVNLRTKEGDPVFGQDRPRFGSLITIAGVTYMVSREEVDPLGEGLQMDLRSKDK